MRPPPPELHRFLRRALFQLRWATILILLLITLAQPALGRTGLPTWALALLFAGYNLLIELLRHRVPRLRPYTLVALLDLPVAGLLYFLDSQPGGPLFLLFFLAVDTAAVSMTLRGTLLYTAATAALAAIVDALLLMWSPTPGDIRLTIARLVMLALVGLGMAILTRRLAMEQAAARAVRDAGERLEALDRLRSDFIATVSHDLRTPLTAARAGLSMLETQVLDRLRPDERVLLDTSRRNIESLNLLIGDLLTFNQLEAGTLRLEREALDLRAVVRTAVRGLRPLVLEKGQHLTVDLPEPLPHRGDPRRLEQVLVNLLANGHGHTPPDSRIAVSGRVTADDVRITVSDDGPGIPAAELEAIFGRFHRLDAAQDGSGLGLAIARRVVELHGGRLWAEVAAGRGASFHVALPRLTTDPDLDLEEYDDAEGADRR